MTLELTVDQELPLNQQITKTIQSAHPDAKVFVLDPRRDGIHLEAVVVSEIFQGKSLLEQHRIVMKLLEPLFQDGLHALGVKTFTLAGWESNRHRFPLIQEQAFID